MSASPVVVLLHAGVADSRMWEPQTAMLEAAGYRVVAPDLRQGWDDEERASTKAISTPRSRPGSVCGSTGRGGHLTRSTQLCARRWER